MLKLNIITNERYDDKTNSFAYETVEVEFEHSLYTMSKWESVTEKPFLTAEDKTDDEVLLYFRCMIMSPNVSDETLQQLSIENIEELNNYISAKSTATWFSESMGTPKQSTKKITSELIYYWMCSYRIDWEAQHWHLERLLTLIKIFDAENTKQKPPSKEEMAERYRKLNAQRRAEMNSKG